MSNKANILKTIFIVLVILTFLVVVFSGIMYFFFDELIEEFNKSKYAAFSGWVITVLGTLLGLVGIVWGFISFFSAMSTPDVNKSKPRALLLRLLDRVEHDWVVGVLENSVHHAALLELGKESQPSQVVNPWGHMLELPTENRLLPAEVTIGQVFQQEATRSLLILGEPGSGKTTTLLQLAQELIAQARNNEQEPIPVVFNLSSWAEKRLLLSEWLVAELRSKYQIPLELGREWLQQPWLLPLLDGLDEVQATVRVECVQAINTFAQGAGVTGLVVCCRQAEYEALKSQRLQLKAAISLQPLNSDQITHYVEAGGEKLAGLRSLLAQDTEMLKLAESPLMLSIMSLAYQNETLSPIANESSDKQSQLFDRYIEKMFTRRKTEPAIYPKDRVIQGLSWLASEMQKRGQTMFLVENLQPDWLRRRLGYVLLMLLSVTIIGLSGLLSGAQPSGALSVSLGLILVFIFVDNDIEAMETLKWYPNKIQLISLIKYLLRSLWFISLFILPPILNTLFFRESTNSSSIGMLVLSTLVIILMITLIVGLPYSLLRAGLQNQIPTPDTKIVVNQGIASSLKNAQIFGLLFGMVGVWLTLFSTLLTGYLTGQYSVDFSLILLVTVLFAMLGFLWLGGLAVFKHYTLRLILILERYTPWNYVRFLDYAARLILLRKVGGSYVFIHRLLLEHLAKKHETADTSASKRT